MNTYKGPTGSIRCVRCHQTLPVVATCGLDGFVRIYNLENKKLLHKVCHVYLLCTSFVVFVVSAKVYLQIYHLLKTLYTMNSTTLPYEKEDLKTSVSLYSDYTYPLNHSTFILLLIFSAFIIQRGTFGRSSP